jgi:hypothetical protein
MVNEVEYEIVFWLWKDDIWYMWWMKKMLADRVFILENKFDEVNGLRLC